MSAPQGRRRWLEDKANVRKIILGTWVLGAVTVVAELFFHKHGHFGFENIFGFHAAYGFVSCVALVLAAGQLRKLLMRPEDYYDSASEPGGDGDIEAHPGREEAP